MSWACDGDNGAAIGPCSGLLWGGEPTRPSPPLAPLLLPLRPLRPRGLRLLVPRTPAPEPPFVEGAAGEPDWSAPGLERD